MIEKELLDLSIFAALKSGDILKEGFGTHYSIRSKEGKHNLVTEFDIKSEETIINILKKEVPDSEFLAEESGISNSLQGQSVKWVIDPLDGTVNFAHNIPIFSISIAAVIDGEIKCGVIYNPLNGELFTAMKGNGAFLGKKKLQTSNISSLLDAFLVTGFPYKAGAANNKSAELFINVVQRGIPIRRLGSAALDLAYVAAGRFDGFWEMELRPWDVAAGVIIVQEAGGIVSQFDNSPFNLGDETILATNGLIHSEVSNFLINHYEN
ncbi:MAG: inositol monophosphatase family protein [Chloroherpetonaceae bacterium]|nr:inositol monophosphatase [bacterium]